MKIYPVCIFLLNTFKAIKSIDDSERSPILKETGKFLATFKVIFDMVFTIVILIVAIGWLFGLIL